MFRNLEDFFFVFINQLLFHYKVSLHNSVKTSYLWLISSDYYFSNPCLFFLNFPIFQFTLILMFFFMLYVLVVACII